MDDSEANNYVAGFVDLTWNYIQCNNIALENEGLLERKHKSSCLENIHAVSE